MENVCYLKMVGDNTSLYSYKKFIDKEFPEVYIDIPPNWENLKGCIETLRTIFSLELKIVNDDVILSGIPLIFESKKEIFEPFLLLLPKITAIDMDEPSEKIQEEIIANAYIISYYVAGYLDNVPGIAEKWTHSDILKLCAEYSPGSKFLKFTTTGDSVMLYKCFERC